MATKCLVLEFDSCYFLDASAAETCKDTRWIFYLLRPFVPSTKQLHVVDALASGEEALNGPTDILRETFDTWVLSVHWAQAGSVYCATEPGAEAAVEEPTRGVHGCQTRGTRENRRTMRSSTGFLTGTKASARSISELMSSTIPPTHANSFVIGTAEIDNTGINFLKFYTHSPSLPHLVFSIHEHRTTPPSPTRTVL
jgi:hypothetical protein